MPLKFFWHQLYGTQKKLPRVFQRDLVQERLPPQLRETVSHFTKNKYISKTA